MGPNEADIIRVYTKAAGSTIADVTLDSAVNAEVVVDVEAGSAVFLSGAQWHLGMRGRRPGGRRRDRRHPDANRSACRAA